MNHNILKRCLLIFAILLAMGQSSFGAGYDYTPAIIHVNKHQQSDTVGFNLVDNVYKLFYKHILDGTFTLWDSPAKKIKIDPNALQLIEDQNNIRFTESADLFIYEYWKLFKKDFEFQILGFSFISRTEDDKKVNFGYIEAPTVQSLLNQVVIPTNINGCNNLSYWQAIMSKTYNFNLVKFGTVDLVQNPALAFDLKNDVFASKKVRTNAYKITPTKDIEYFVLPGLDSTSGQYWLCRAIEQYFEQNRHEYYNMTPTPAVDFMDIHTPLKITRLEISETWQKTGALDITYTPQKVRIFINDKPMPELSMADINQMKLLVQFKPFAEFLRDKEFKYTIKRVNYEPIYGYQADEIKTALFTKDWNKLRYVPPKTIKDRNNPK